MSNKDKEKGDLFKLLKIFSDGTFALIASISSVFGLLIVIFFDKVALIVALSCLVLFLLLILLRFYSVTKRFILQKTENGYHKFATYIRYSTTDGKHIAYELHKYLQCKKIIMDEYVHSFHWSGTKEPIISSDLQECTGFYKTPLGEFDRATFRFKKPLTYNDFTIIHIKMDIDDSDFASRPYCQQGVKEPLQLINFRVELLHKDNNPDAKILKRKISSGQIENTYENIGFVKFDTVSRSYEKSIFFPTVGYSYKIEWEK